MLVYPLLPPLLACTLISLGPPFCSDTCFSFNSQAPGQCDTRAWDIGLQGLNCGIEGVRMLNIVVRASQVRCMLQVPHAKLAHGSCVDCERSTCPLNGLLAFADASALWASACPTPTPPAASVAAALWWSMSVCSFCVWTFAKASLLLSRGCAVQDQRGMSSGGSSLCWRAFTQEFLLLALLHFSCCSLPVPTSAWWCPAAQSMAGLSCHLFGQARLDRQLLQPPRLIKHVACRIIWTRCRWP